jgi:hypothetical protein
MDFADYCLPGCIIKYRERVAITICDPDIFAVPCHCCWHQPNGEGAKTIKGIRFNEVNFEYGSDFVFVGCSLVSNPNMSIIPQQYGRPINSLIIKYPYHLIICVDGKDSVVLKVCNPHIPTIPRQGGWSL